MFGRRGKKITQTEGAKNENAVHVQQQRSDHVRRLTSGPHRQRQLRGCHVQHVCRNVTEIQKAWARYAAPMQRVAIVGSGGSGKTTFARRLGERTGIPVIHLDQHYWQPGWVPMSRNDWEARQLDLVAGARWIIDGNYGGSFDVRFKRADTVIVLALPRWLCLVRALQRTGRNRGRDIQAAGCPERLELAFLRWVWRYPVDGRPRLNAAIERHQDHLRVIELSSPGQVGRFLAQFG